MSSADQALPIKRFNQLRIEAEEYGFHFERNDNEAAFDEFDIGLSPQF